MALRDLSPTYSVEEALEFITQAKEYKEVYELILIVQSEPHHYTKADYDKISEACRPLRNKVLDEKVLEYKMGNAPWNRGKNGIV